MAYNTMQVIEAKRRLSEQTAELKRTGGPHQQTLAADIAMLLDAHTAAIERIGTLEHTVDGSTKQAQALLESLDQATKAAQAAEVKLAQLGGLGVASTEGKTLTEIRDDIKNDKGYPVA